MKKYFYLIAALILIINPVKAQDQTSEQSPYYTWLGEKLETLTNFFGPPADIVEERDFKIYSYNFEQGYQAFIIQNNQIVKISMTTYWQSKGQAKDAFNYSQNFYKNNGFSLKKKSSSLVSAENSEYKITIEMSYLNKTHLVSETATFSNIN